MPGRGRTVEMRMGKERKGAQIARIWGGPDLFLPLKPLRFSCKFQGHCSLLSACPSGTQPPSREA